MSEFRLICGDVLDGLRSLPDASAQCVVTSPPYWGLRDYGLAGQIGHEATPGAYIACMVAVFAEVRRVLRPDGVVWLNLGDTYARAPQKGNNHGYGKHATIDGLLPGDARPLGPLQPKNLAGIPWRVALALQADGWILRADVIWAKANPMPESVVDRPTKAHEYIFLLTRAERYFYDREAIIEPLATDAAENYPARARVTGRGGQGYAAARGASPDRGKSGGFPPCYRGSTFTSGKTAANKPNVGQGERYAHPGRNKRSVWTVASEPFPGAHFATFPPSLIEPCILAGTSERGCCPACGAPWRRDVARRPMVIARSGRGAAIGEMGRTAASGTVVAPARAETKGWQPTCRRHDAAPVPCTVLDPFAGSGTVGLVALRHGRRFVGIELNPQYVEMARRRIVADAPLLNREAVES